MSTSRTWVISSGLVGAIFLMFRSILNSVTGPRSFLPTLPPIFIVQVIIFVLAASAAVFGNGADDSPVTNHHPDDYTSHHQQDHHDDHDHGRDRSSINSSKSSLEQYNNKVQKEAKFPVTSKSTRGSFGMSSPDVSFPSTPPEKPVGIRRPPIAPLNTFPQANTSGDENETMEEMWERVKAEKQPKKPKTTMSSSSWPSPSPSPSPSRGRRPPLSPGRSKMKLMERMPSWMKLKKELSMGREELNSKVEAFITKIKDEMKLQRLESVKRNKGSTSRTNDK